VTEQVADNRHVDESELPRQVMAGYTMIVAEALEQIPQHEPPTHIFVPGGVGGLAAATLSHLRLTLGEEAPRFVVVEPNLAPCLFESARNGRRTSLPIDKETIMAGLSCGEPSALAWPILAAGADDFITIPDELVPPAMTLLGAAPFGDPRIVAGESAVAGLCALLATSSDPQLAAELGVDANSRVLLLGTEGATDPEIYRQLTGLLP
jgi:diaminopropionate ammonia-lyase